MNSNRTILTACLILALAGCSTTPELPQQSVLTGGTVDALAATAPLAGSSNAVTYAGDGRLGAVTRAGTVYEDTPIQATDYVLSLGSTVTTHGQSVTIYATNSITIAGTIDVRGRGAQAGMDGVGIAGQSGNVNGGGGSGIPTPDRQEAFLQGRYDFATLIGAGGGSASCLAGQKSHGAGGAGNTWTEGSRGTETSQVASTGTPGLGGAGGGRITLVAPSITITGTLDARGMDGTSGTGTCGGGGGGAGGIIILQGATLDNRGTVLVSGGAGATSPNGGNGGGAAPGQLIRRQAA